MMHARARGKRHCQTPPVPEPYLNVEQVPSRPQWQMDQMVADSWVNGTAGFVIDLHNLPAHTHHNVHLIQ